MSSRSPIHPSPLSAVSSPPRHAPPVAWPGTERAQPLIPAWFLALLSVAGLVLLVGRPAAPAHRLIATLSTPLPAPVGPCGPMWGIEQQTAGTYILRTIGAASATPPPCALPIAAGSARLIVHADGDSAILSTAGAMEVAPIPASGWYAIPINVGGDELIVQPSMGGGDLTLTVRIPGR